MNEFYDNERKLNSADSTTASNLLKDFYIQTNETLDRIENLETFEEFDLKNPAFAFVETISKLVRDAFSEILTHSYSKHYTPEQMEKIKDDFQKEFILINSTFKEAQDEFQIHQ